MYTNTGKHFILKTEKTGGLITLDDKSRWEISSISDKMKSMMWSVVDDVNVSDSYGKFKITHIKRDETVEATFLPE